MATDVERLIVTLEARTKEYERALAKAQNTTVSALRKVERDMAVSAKRQQATWARMGAGIQQTLQRSVMGPLAALAGGAGLARLGRAARSAIGEVAGLAETADKVGLTVEALQELRFAADQTGVAQSALDMAMQRFSRRVGEAVQGSGELVGTLRQYNIQLRDSEGNTRPLVDILKDYADVIKNAGSQQERLRIAFKGFDSEGAALVNTLKDGSAGLDGYFASARDAGIITDSTARKAEELDRQFKAAATTLDTVWKQAVIDLADNLGDIAPLTEFIAREMKGFAEGLKTSKREIEAIIGIFDALDASMRQFGEDHDLNIFGDRSLEQLERAKTRVQANIQAMQAEMENLSDTARDLGFGERLQADIKAAEAELKQLERAIVETFNRLNPGPDFERMGRESAEAFEKGFQPKISLPTVTRGTGTPNLTGGAQGVADSLHRSIAIQKESDPVARRMLQLQEQLVGSTQQEVAYIQRLIAEEERLLRSSETIAGHAGRTADGMRDIPPGFDRLGDRFAGAIGQQTSALMTGLQRMEAAAASANAANTSGAFGGSAGGAQHMRFSVNVAARKELDRLADERAVIQAGMGVKQLSPAEEQQAQLRLAQIDLETAKLNQHMGDVATAFQDLRPMMSQMLLAGWDFEQVVSALNSDLKRRFGTSGAGVNYFSSSNVPGFAGGGVLRGPGGPTGDKIPVMGSDEEFMVNARQSRKHRALLWAINEDRLPGYADGGLVNRVNASAQRLAGGGVVKAASAASRGDINITLGGVNVTAQDGAVSPQSARDAARQIASEVAYELREMGLV